MELWNYRPKIIIHGILFLVSNFVCSLIFIYFYSFFKHNSYDYDALLPLYIVFYVFVSLLLFLFCYFSFKKFLKYEWLLDKDNYWKLFFVFIGIASLFINSSIFGCVIDYNSMNKAEFGYSDYVLNELRIENFYFEDGTITIHDNDYVSFETYDSKFTNELQRLKTSEIIEIKEERFYMDSKYISFYRHYDNQISIYENGYIVTSTYQQYNGHFYSLYYYNQAYFKNIYNLCISLYENMPTQIE